MTGKEMKRERFCRVAEKRADKLVAMLNLLGNCSSPNSYEYTEEQLQAIFTRVQTALQRAIRRFENEQKGLKRFSLSGSEPNCPYIDLHLPDGSILRAVAIDDDNFPAVNINLIDGNGEQPVCFAEYNPEHAAGKELSIGVYRSDTDETVFYESYYERRQP